MSNSSAKLVNSKPFHESLKHFKCVNKSCKTVGITVDDNSVLATPTRSNESPFGCRSLITLSLFSIIFYHNFMHNCYCKSLHFPVTL